MTSEQASGKEKEARDRPRRVQFISAPWRSAGGFIHMIYGIVPALGFCVCSRSHSSQNVFIMCATFKLPLPSTLSLVSRPDVFPPHAFPPAKQLLFKTTKINNKS